MSYLVITSRDTNDLPVSLPDLKQHLSIIGNQDDTRLIGLEWAAVEFIERQTNRAITPTTYTEEYDWFPTLWQQGHYYDWYFGPFYPYPLLNTPTGLPWRWGRMQRIELSRSPVTAVTAVQYYDTNNVLTTIDPSKYDVVLPTDRPGFIQPSSLVGVWPIPFYRPDAVKITYTAGPTNQPYVAAQAIKLLASAWNDNRADFDTSQTYQIPIGVKALINTLTPGGYY